MKKILSHYFYHGFLSICIQMTIKHAIIHSIAFGYINILGNVKLTLLLDGVQRVDEAGRDKSFRSIWSLHPEPFRVILEKMSQIFPSLSFNEFNPELLR